MDTVCPEGFLGLEFDKGSGKLETVEVVRHGGWVIPEAGEKPARPRHCEKPENTRNAYLRRPLGK